MSRKIKTTNIIEAYEFNGSDIKGHDRPTITIQEHWNRKEFVVVTIGEHSLTVLAEAVIKAVKNSTNAHSY